MKNHRHIGTDEQIEKHSLPGINMAGKEAGVKECDCSDQDAGSEREPDPVPEEKASAPKPPRD